MIDIHCHILPGVDDGARDLRAALEMARVASDRGTRTIIATPHVAHRRHYRTRAPKVAGWVHALQQAIDDADLPVRVLPGAEVDLMPSVPAALDAGVPLTLGHGGRYLLFDSPFYFFHAGLYHTLAAVLARGITPIVAHPERARPIQQNPGLLEGLVQQGVLLEVNGASLLGGHGTRAQITARELLRLHWVHFIASDAHNPRHRNPSLQPALDFLMDFVGAEETYELLWANGTRVTAGVPVPSAPLPYRRDRGWWRLWEGQGGTST